MTSDDITNSYSFVFFYFNELIWLLSAENKMSMMEKRGMMDIILDYKARYPQVKSYKNKQIWGILHRKFSKWFDEMLEKNY